MAKKIGVLLKVFSCEEFRESFLSGILYMNTIEFFRNFEESIEGNIADKHEALTAWMQPHDFILELEVDGVKHVFNPEDMAGPMTTSMKLHNNANVFCMTQLHSHDLDMTNLKGEEEIKLARSYFTLPKEVEALGDYTVVITNPSEFLNRFRNAAQKLCEEQKANWYCSKQVQYYDELNSSLVLEDLMNAPFHKQSKYSHQSEYRLCVISDNASGEVLKLDIGDIKDIAFKTMTKDFNSLLELKIIN
jgi:hypothetical protein